jgi:cell fate (sporulation/competence/biofilm development) regulator YlbF (YheA/YmcA/DUF963 family)
VRLTSRRYLDIKQAAQPSIEKISGYQMPDEKEVQVLVRMTAAMAEKLDEYRRSQPDLPSRPEAVRRIVAERLAS